jgi:hypothetical protein
MERYKSKFEERNIKMEILFSKEDFLNFINNYLEEFKSLNIKIKNYYDNQINKMRVILFGKADYLTSNYFTRDIEKNYSGAIA